jgi:hypothetical protein
LAVHRQFIGQASPAIAGIPRYWGKSALFLEAFQGVCRDTLERKMVAPHCAGSSLDSRSEYFLSGHPAGALHRLEAALNKGVNDLIGAISTACVAATAASVCFYSRAHRDPLIGPVFEGRVHD